MGKYELENVMIEKLEELIIQIDLVSNKFIEGNVDAMQSLIQVIDNLQEIINKFIECEVNEELIKKLNGYLYEIVTALENMDTMLIGDLMKYELTPIIDEIILDFKCKYN